MEIIDRLPNGTRAQMWIRFDQFDDVFQSTLLELPFPVAVAYCDGLDEPVVRVGATRISGRDNALAALKSLHVVPHSA